MKLLFWRRKPRAEAESSVATAVPAEPAASIAMIERSQIPTRPLAMPIELRDALLRFALDCLVAGGARVRVEADDLISAVLPDGTLVRYTTSLTRARAEADTELLVQGGAALAQLLDACAAHAAVASLRLEAHAEPLEIVRSQLAAPPADCGACVHGEHTELCQSCPLRTNRMVLAGMAKHAAPRIARQWMGRGVELTYSIISNDRHGRRDEQVRVALEGETGSHLPLLAPELLADAQAQNPPRSAAKELNVALTRAERALTPQLHAAGSLLRLLAEREYRARLDDIQTTSRRLLRESPDEAPAIHEALERELARLGEVYAVEVDARLTSTCFVERPLAAVTIPTQAGTSVELVADLAAGILLSPTCTACRTDTRAASICAQGHLICPACRRHDDADSHSGCPICAGVSMANSPSDVLSEPGALTLAHVDAMSAATWRLFVTWLLEQDGYRIERGATLDSLDYWLCRSVSGDETLLAGAIRFADRRCLSREDVERLAAQRASQLAPPALLISTASAGESAREASQRLGVRLLDRTALSERLDGLVARQLHEREAAGRDQQTRAEAAATTRSALLSELQHAEEALASAANTRRAAGRSAVASAASTLMDALVPAQRALLAWETLIHDWTAAFDEREA
ncbi:MAG TPA: hypothetical protein VKT52_04115, partial [Ktedonobacterales bacterium]|nr:hypothetical protein [Ktedonobacterales bacterium]